MRTTRAVALSVVLAMGCGCATMKPAASGAKIAVTATEDGGTVAVDIIKAMNNERVKNAGILAKPFVAVGQVIGTTIDFAGDHPIQAAVGAYIITRASQGKLDDDWDKVFGGSSADGSTAPVPPGSGEGGEAIIVNVQDNPGNVEIIINSGSSDDNRNATDTGSASGQDGDSD